MFRNVEGTRIFEARQRPLDKTPPVLTELDVEEMR